MYDWQTILTLIIVACAASLIVSEIRNLLLKQQTGSCGKCSNCPTGDQLSGENVFVSLELNEPNDHVRVH